MIFIGIDLAWSERNKTGVSVLKGDRRRAEFVSGEVLHTDEEIIDKVKGNVKKDGIVAIDAPLIVPNKKGRRVAEEVTGRLFRKYNAGAHPANRERLSSWTGTIRGEEISKKLVKEGFKQDPYFKRFCSGKKFIEVYPHPSMVVLFDLDNVIKYKAKPRRDYEFRYGEFRKYQKCLKGLKNAKPSLVLPKEIVNKDVGKLKGKALKDYEDLLDSIFCAYIAYYNWVYPEKCAVLGDMKKGYISTPVLDHMKKEI